MESRDSYPVKACLYSLIRSIAFAAMRFGLIFFTSQLSFNTAGYAAKMITAMGAVSALAVIQGIKTHPMAKFHRGNAPLLRRAALIVLLIEILTFASIALMFSSPLWSAAKTAVLSVLLGVASECNFYLLRLVLEIRRRD